jgi:hypothetical protein
MLKEVDIRTYEYSYTHTNVVSTASLQTHIIWHNVICIDTRWYFRPFTGCDSFYLTWTYVFKLSKRQLRCLIHCFHRLFFAIDILLGLTLLLTQLLYRPFIWFVYLCSAINRVQKLFLLVTQLLYRPFVCFLCLCYANVLGLTKTEKTNKLIINVLREKQEQLQAIIFGPTMMVCNGFC